MAPTTCAPMPTDAWRERQGSVVAVACEQPEFPLRGRQPSRASSAVGQALAGRRGGGGRWAGSGGKQATAMQACGDACWREASRVTLEASVPKANASDVSCPPPLVTTVAAAAACTGGPSAWSGVPVAPVIQPHINVMLPAATCGNRWSPLGVSHRAHLEHEAMAANPQLPNAGRHWTGPEADQAASSPIKKVARIDTPAGCSGVPSSFSSFPTTQLPAIGASSEVEAWTLLPTTPQQQQQQRAQTLRSLATLATVAAPVVSSFMNPQEPECQLVLWDCRHPHGLFSMFSLALGHADTLLKQGCGLIVDWSHSSLLYAAPSWEPSGNLWTALFRQPAEVAGFASQADISAALASGRVHVTTSSEHIFGDLRGVIEGYGSISWELAQRGRQLCRQLIQPSPYIAERLAYYQAMLLGSGRRWLAVHIRRTDKACEAKSNLLLDDEAILRAILRSCHINNTTGVFLCTDDAALKARLTARMRSLSGPFGELLRVSTYDAALSMKEGTAAHFDTSLDSFQKAEDVVLECLLMARGCHALLSTYSNVSAAAVYLSHDEYSWSSFWDMAQD
eukprot:TRINITY_DN14892_c0_g1_i10.p1 TRINITY_DN14892_c0_g1~~TRINITY_DN14892_c0_g1_i10.p1  ORF type:complete len:565 (-),score=111.46 TRINITY_DN14892_c0_g1_i10:339-2033(-)